MAATKKRIPVKELDRKTSVSVDWDMWISIKKVAIDRGITMGTALKQAMRLWLNENS